MNILDIFKDVIQEGMEIVKCKELSNKYKLILSYNGMSASCELNKLCTPGNEKSLCMQAIDNAISTMYLSKGDLKEAEAWLHGERWDLKKEENENVNMDDLIEYLDKTVFYKYHPCNIIDDVKSALENYKLL